MMLSLPPAGWYVIGPMEALCIHEAEDEDAVLALYEGQYVGKVVPIHVSSNGSSVPSDLTCALCGRLIQG